MSEKSLKDQYLEYVEGFLKGLFNMSTWHEHTTGTELSAEEQQELLLSMEEQLSDLIINAVKGADKE